MKDIYALIVLRALDVTSTMFSILTFGTAVENNPFMRWLMDKGLTLFLLYQVLLTLALVMAFYLTQQSRVSRLVIKGFNIAVFLVVVSNIISYALAIRVAGII